METNSTTSSSTDNCSKEVIIKLSESTYAHAFEDSARIHSFEYERVLDMIDNQIKGIQNHPMTIEEEKQYALVRRHNTIAIFGGRGSGKTSFLHTVFAECAKKYTDKVEILKIVDPTLIETKGHVFLWIISLINEKVEARLNMGETDQKYAEYDRRKEWKDAVHQLARGLHSLENVGIGMKNEHWHDDYFVVESGLKQVNGALNLEANFRKMVDTALSILNKKAFLIAFDDIDVDMEKGWPVMETIRKYLTTDKIIVLLSGNLRLYSLNVRRHQWEQLGKLPTEWEKDADFKTIVSEVEGQYLMKLLKAENRVFLHSIMDNIRSQKYKYLILDDVTPQKEQIIQPIKQIYKEALKELGIVSRTQSNIFCNYLLSLSVRSQMHFIRGINTRNQDGTRRKTQIVDQFMARMYAANIDIDYAINHPQMINMVTLKYLVNQDFDLYLLMPSVEDEDINGCVTGLSFLFAKKVTKNPFLIFDYFIRIGYMRNLLLACEDNYFKEKLCNYSSLFQDMSLKNIVGLSIAYTEYLKYNHKEHILLSLKNKKNFKFDTILENKTSQPTNDAQKVITLIPLCSTKKTSLNESHQFYSSFVLLAAIGQILRFAYSELEENNKDVGISEVLRELKDMQLHRYYSVPSTKQDGNNTEGNIEADTLEFNVKGDQTTDKLATSLYEWSCQYFPFGASSKTSIPPYLLGKILTRYINAVSKITQNNLGDQMHYSMISLLNACLVEEAKENYNQYVDENTAKKQNDKKPKHDTLANLNFSNSVNSDRVFRMNIKFIKDNNAWETIKLTKWLIQCPLIYSFIKEEHLQNYYTALNIESSVINNEFLVHKVISSIIIKSGS